MDKTGRMYKRTAFAMVFAVIFFLISPIFCACTANNRYDGELLRLHIRAHSDAAEDQEVKLKVRDAINAYLARNIDKSSFREAYDMIEGALGDIAGIAQSTLSDSGFGYGARVRLGNEYFPTRVYGGYIVPDGYYDALIVELGDGAGDNWWCVVYPPLCYGDKFEYRSFFAELFGSQ